MARAPLYTTYPPGALEDRIRQIDPQGLCRVSEAQLRGAAGQTGTGGRGVAIVRALACVVTFPDGKEGQCRYERRGCSWHRFRYAYCDGADLPYEDWTHLLSGDPVAIEAKAQELAASCYRQAILREQKDYFRRAAEPSDGSRKRRPEKYMMTAARAKTQAGCYAVCRKSGETVFTLSPVLYETIEKANAEWRQRGDPSLLVLCCNRLDRCWELPRYNPLYGEHAPREQTPLKRNRRSKKSGV